MRTVATLVASGAGIGIASIGLAVVCKEPSETPHPSREPSPSKPGRDMTAVASFTHATLSSPFALSTPQSGRTLSEGRNGKARSGSAKIGQKRTLTPSAHFAVGMEKAVEEGERDGGSRAGTPNSVSRPQSWLRRLSSSMSTSRDSSHTTISRPNSAAISQSNGSEALSHTDSTEPMFRDSMRDSTPPPLARNRLVKRSSSVRSISSSALQTPGSKLPLPVLKRPATSHQRSATLQEHSAGSDRSDRMSLDGVSSSARDPQLRQYFTPRIASDEWVASSRRSSSGIPTPIKRIYPDRRYTPMLVAASSDMKRARVEFDDQPSSQRETSLQQNHAVAQIAASSPLPGYATQFGDPQAPRRSFSIGDLLSTGPQPLWRRPSQVKSKVPGNKVARKGRRVPSTPQSAMGNILSGGTESERPAKRRDLSAAHTAARSIYSSSSSTQPTDSDLRHEIQLGLGTDHPQSHQINTSGARFEDTPSPADSSLVLEQRRLPSANHYSTSAKLARVSAAQSEIASTIDSDSEVRSVGDASTDYQSDVAFDSYPTRTTRSSSGRRGPHIGTVFDESPPNFSSGRSTKLTDVLWQSPAGEHDTAYRHSTIEEEGSIVSTPVRSLRNNSVTSTPSARPGAHQAFTSSPPAIPDETDWDEPDWDAPDDEDPVNGLGFQGSAMTGLNSAGMSSLAPVLGSSPAQPPSNGSNGAGHGHDWGSSYEWADAGPNPSQNNSPPRPKTVHGKKDTGSRGPRASGRRGPSGAHTRSASVPTKENKTETVVANKYGTWGLGMRSKVPTEDWNDDFEFDPDAPTEGDEEPSGDQQQSAAPHIRIPPEMRETGEKVDAGADLLLGWKFTIDELKELRRRAVLLGVVDEEHAKLWQEVDAMIELSDQEDPAATVEPRHSPPSSPGFDYGAFDEPMPSITDTVHPLDQSLRLPEAAFQEAGPSSSAVRGSPHPATPQHSSSARPRKDSEAVARSVIEAVKAKRSVSDPTTLDVVPKTKKVDFFSGTLREIVPYLNLLKWRVKDAIRQAEGLQTSPKRRPSSESGWGEQDQEEHSLLSIFNDPRPNESPLQQRSRREQADTDHDDAEEPSSSQRSDLALRFQNMNLPR